MRRFVLGVIILTAAGAARAQPHFDTAAYCHGVATERGTLLQSKLQYCLQTERSSFARLRAEWSRIPDATRSHCTEVASSAGPGSAGQGSYGSFVTCVEAGRDTGGGD